MTRPEPFRANANCATMVDQPQPTSMIVAGFIFRIIA